jgi:hypothetical protein
MLFGQRFGMQRRRRGLGRREVEVRDAGDDPAVHLLWPGMVDVPGPKPRLDMSDGDAAIISGKRRHHRRQRVAMDNDAVRLLEIEGTAKRSDEAGGQAAERLVALHDVEIDVGLDPADAQHLVEKLAMLGRDADARLDVGSGAQGVNHGKHLDRLGPGPEYDDDFLPGHSLSRPTPRPSLA